MNWITVFSRLGQRMKELLNLLPHKANRFKVNAVSVNQTQAENQVNRLKNHLKVEIENRDKMNKNGTLPPTINIKDFIRLQQADHIHKVRQTNIGNHETENIKFSHHKANSTSPDRFVGFTRLGGVFIDLNSSVRGADEDSSSSSSSSSSSDSKKSGERNATSTEVFDDMVKKLKSLNSEKRRKIMDMLSGENRREQQKKSPQPADDEDEVEILDISEPKMGIYKRKRSTTQWREQFRVTRT